MENKNFTFTEAQWENTEITSLQRVDKYLAMEKTGIPHTVRKPLTVHSLLFITLVHTQNCYQ